MELPLPRVGAPLEPTVFLTRDTIFTDPFLISYVTRHMTLEPGDVLITGTPEGVSEILPGDTVTASVQGVGSVTNRVRGVTGESSGPL